MSEARRSAAIATLNIIRVDCLRRKLCQRKWRCEWKEATSLLLVRKERQTKVALEPKERGGRRPIIIPEENHSRADSHRRYLPQEKRDAPFCTLRRNFQSPLLSLLTPSTRQWLHYKHRAKDKNCFLLVHQITFFFSPLHKTFICNFHPFATFTYQSILRRLERFSIVISKVLNDN